MSEHNGPLIWLDGEGGELMTPDAMAALIASGDATVISQTADTVTLEREHRLDATFRLVRDADYV